MQFSPQSIDLDGIGLFLLHSCALIYKKYTTSLELVELRHDLLFWNVDFTITLNNNPSPPPNFRPTPTPR